MHGKDNIIYQWLSPDRKNVPLTHCYSHELIILGGLTVICIEIYTSIFQEMLQLRRKDIGDHYSTFHWRNASQVQTQDNFTCLGKQHCPLLMVTYYEQNLSVWSGINPDSICDWVTVWSPHASSSVAELTPCALIMCCNVLKIPPDDPAAHHMHKSINSYKNITALQLYNGDTAHNVSLIQISVFIWVNNSQIYGRGHWAISLPS